MTPNSWLLRTGFKDLDLSSLSFLSFIVSTNRCRFVFKLQFVCRSSRRRLTNRLAWKSDVLRVFWGTLLIGSGGLSLLYTRRCEDKRRLLARGDGRAASRRGGMKRQGRGGGKGRRGCAAKLSQIGETHGAGYTPANRNTGNTLVYKTKRRVASAFDIT